MPTIQQYRDGLKAIVCNPHFEAMQPEMKATVMFMIERKRVLKARIQEAFDIAMANLAELEDNARAEKLANQTVDTYDASVIQERFNTLWAGWESAKDDNRHEVANCYLRRLNALDAAVTRTFGGAGFIGGQLSITTREKIAIKSMGVPSPLPEAPKPNLYRVRASFWEDSETIMYDIPAATEAEAFDKIMHIIMTPEQREELLVLETESVVPYVDEPVKHTPWVALPTPDEVALIEQLKMIEVLIEDLEDTLERAGHGATRKRTNRELVAQFKRRKLIREQLGFKPSVTKYKGFRIQNIIPNKFTLFLEEEWKYEKGYRTEEWETYSLAEAHEWIDSYNAE